MLHRISESDVEALATQCLRDLGWSVCVGASLGPKGYLREL